MRTKIRTKLAERSTRSGLAGLSTNLALASINPPQDTAAIVLQIVLGLISLYEVIRKETAR